VQWLGAAARLTSLEALLRSPPAASLEVAITFDDGYASVHDQALPELAAVGATATVYLNTGWIRDDAPRSSQPQLGHYPGESFMRWAQAEALTEAGWTLGSHGVDHLDLTRESPNTCRDQLVRSHDEIARRTGRECTHFAYTWGRSTPQLRSLVSQCGYSYAAGGLHGPVRSNFDPLEIPRINVKRDYSLDDFKAVVLGDWDYLRWVQRARRRAS
jgi:peptidoglycan/xylan/chitin deacetylase (PgdA/CDA1 family)